jgi:hypothetical protein
VIDVPYHIPPVEEASEWQELVSVNGQVKDKNTGLKQANSYEVSKYVMNPDL